VQQVRQQLTEAFFLKNQKACAPYKQKCRLLVDRGIARKQCRWPDASKQQALLVLVMYRAIKCKGALLD
jgi:hypothetical protein